MFDDVSFHFHDVNGETSFSRIRNIRNIYINACITMTVLGGFSFHVMGGKLNDTLAFSSFLCVRTEIGQ